MRFPLRKDQRESAPNEVVGERFGGRWRGGAIAFAEKSHDLAERERHDTERNCPATQNAFLVVVQQGAVGAGDENACSGMFGLYGVHNLRPVLDKLDFVKEYIPDAGGNAVFKKSVKGLRISQRSVFQQFET